MTFNIDEYPQIYNKVNINTEFINNNYCFDNHIPSLENTTNVVRNDIKITPPLYPVTLSSACIKNGYLYPKSLQGDPYPKCKTYDNFYYPSQQINKIIEEKDNKNVEEKDNKKIEEINNKNIDKKEEKKNIIINNSKNLYELEPRFNSVIYPWRGYTWMYPLKPNTENYYVDDIKSSPVNPIIIPNLNLQNNNSGVKNPLLERFNVEKKNGIDNLEILYIIVIIILIYFLIVNRKIY